MNTVQGIFNFVFVTVSADGDDYLLVPYLYGTGTSRDK